MVLTDENSCFTIHVLGNCHLLSRWLTLLIEKFMPRRRRRNGIKGLTSIGKPASKHSTSIPSLSMRFAPFVFAFSLLQSSVLVQAAPNPVAVLYGGLPVFSQCGGIGWNDPTICASGLYCNWISDYYSACFPSGVPVTTRY
ncbi:hypothetical protein BJ165DRAFT_1482126 [Panaeolus papilionaceus]|nr:hypothetical protein BJ165DRAFT_1482126 [Panaeolus papilionaceus]